MSSSLGKRIGLQAAMMNDLKLKYPILFDLNAWRTTEEYFNSLTAYHRNGGNDLAGLYMPPDRFIEILKEQFPLLYDPNLEKDLATFKAELAKIRATLGDFYYKVIFPHKCRLEGPFSPGSFFTGAQFGNMAMFTGATFGDDVRFTSAVFGDDATFTEAAFGDGTDFTGATFGDGTDFTDTTFGDDATFIGAAFGNEAFFNGTQFGNDARFEEATFGDEVYFEGAKFGNGTIFNGASFSGEVYFQYARASSYLDFQDSTFGKNKQSHTLLSGNIPSLDLRGATGYILDGCYTQGSRFSPRARDPWSKLRRMYTGPRLLFNLLFILAFLVPYAAKTMLWVGVNRAQDALETTSDSLVVRIDQQAVKAQALLGRAEDRLRNRNEALATRIAEAAANVDIRMLRSRLRALEEDVRAADTLAADFLAQAAQLITTAAPDSSLLSPCLQEHCQEYAIIEVLLSLDRLDDHGAEEDGTSMTLAARFGPTILAVLLILYNVCRGLLTWLVAPMRDEEERSGHAPSYEPENGYGGRFIEIARDSTIPWYRVPLAWSTEVFSTYRWLTGPRIAVQTLFWVAMVVLAYNVYLFLFATTVQLPAG